MPDLGRGLVSYETLRKELLERWPELDAEENAEVLDDTLEGISLFPDMIAAVIRSAIADELTADALNEQINRMRARRDRLNERRDRKRSLALHYAQEARLRRIPAPDFTASVTPGRGKVIITDEHALGDAWVRVKREPDKEAIGRALRAGVAVDGAELSNPMPRLTVSTK